MINRRSLLRISSNTIRYIMAGVVQRDLHTLSIANPCSNLCTYSPIRSCNRRFVIKSCSSANYTSVLRCVGDFKSNVVQNGRVYAPYLPPEVVWAGDQRKVLDSRVLNGDGGVNRGNSSGFLDQRLPERVMVAVDVDEVLGNFVSALNKFIADRYSLIHSVSEYHVYEFFKIWNCSRDEGIDNMTDLVRVCSDEKVILNNIADLRVHEFFKTHYFKKGIYPIPGAQKALQGLSNICNLSIVTSRQNVIKDHTIDWIEKHYPGLFQEIHFGNHFALDGQSRSKSDICKSLGAKVLIDDNPRYAIECAEAGINVFLFDYENSYPWCKTDNVCRHPLITKVHNWEEVEHQLSSLIVS